MDKVMQGSTLMFRALTTITHARETDPISEWFLLQRLIKKSRRCDLIRIQEAKEGR
jgi:hypothetical protein